jgi:hypothetical protein
MVPTLLAWLVFVVTAGWALMSHLRSRPRRPREAAPAIEVGAESPAIVDLLTDDFAVTPEAVPATVVDLAARRWLSIEEVAGGNVLLRLSGRDGDGLLQPYEHRVLEHLRGLEVSGVVPAAAMTTGPAGASKAWWAAFRREVIVDAQTRGLSRDRWTKAMLVPIWAGVIGAGSLLWLGDRLGEPRDELSRPALVGALWVVALLALAGLGIWSFTVLRRGLQRDTDAGLAAATRWLGVREHMATVGDFEDKPAAMVAIWDRHLAHAVALDLAPTVVAQLPLGAESHRHAWSRATGGWRQVIVHYPVMRPGYGQHPAFALFSGAGVGAGALLVLRFASRVRSGEVDVFADLTGDTTRGIDVAALAVGGIAVLVLAWNIVKVGMAANDLFRVDVREGPVVRSRVRRGWVGLVDRPSGSEDHAKERFFVALDTGADQDISAWRVRRAIFDQLRQGERHRVRVTPRLRYVASVDPVPPVTSGPGS